MTRTKSTLTLTLYTVAALATLSTLVTTAAYAGGPTKATTKAKRVSLVNLSSCVGLLKEAFPDNKIGGWRIQDCSKVGVTAEGKDGRFAVLVSGEIFQIAEDGSVTLFAD